MKISINAGHTVSGKGTGAEHYLKESMETRVITNNVINLLKEQGHTVYNHTVDSAISVNESLSKIVELVNKSDAELFVSIHFNASNGKGHGSEVYTYNGENHSEASLILNNLNVLGFENRGIKNGNHLYVINKTSPKALLIEVCFIDNLADVELYLKNIYKVSEAIVNGIIGKETTDNKYLKEFENAKKQMISLGITDGSNPKKNVTREELWTMLNRLYKKLST